MAMDSGEEAEALRREVTRLRAENEELRSHFRVGPAEEDSVEEDEVQPVAVILTPDPLMLPREGGPGSKAVADMARVLVRAMEDRRPDLEWRAEHDLTRIPDGAQCFHMGDVLKRGFGGERIPPTYGVERGDDSTLKLRRCIVRGEPESERFLDSRRRLNQDFDDLAAEGEAAFTAGETHHAGWALKALDVVLAQMNLARVQFETDGDWRNTLEKPRPEYLLPRGTRIDSTPITQSS